METNIDRNSVREYMDSNHIIFWSGSHSENKIGIYIMGGCDLPSAFSCVPLIKPILKGTCCILKEGQIEKSRSDILLQSLKNHPQDLLAPVLEKFYLPGNFFENQLFSPNFKVSNGNEFEEFPKQVVILSIAPDVARVVYQHREHGFLIDPSGWWNNQRMDLMLRDLSSANWFRKHFVSLGRMTVETFIENFTQLISQIKQATNAHILVFNILTIEPGNIIHNYQFVKRPESLRRREFNLALAELSRKLNFWIVDIDKVLKQTRTKNMVDFAHFPVELYQPIGQEVFKILEELEIFQVPNQSLSDSSREWILGMTTGEEQVVLEDYIKQQVQEKTQIQIEQLQTKLQQTQTKVQQTEQELSQSQSQLSATQAELRQLKSYLQQMQAVEGIMGYYRWAIASNPDDLQLYHQALTIKPDDDQIHWQLGNALVRQNRFDDAIASYQRAIEINPDYSWSHQHLGDALAELGKIHAASTCYRRALQLQPRIF